MSDDRWRQIEELFHQAADLAPADRAAFLRRACDGDEELQREVESLLAADASRDTFLKAAVADATSLLPSAPDRSAGLIGKRIGPYSITRVIGKGGMGSVYGAVRDDDIRMQVAVKLLARGTDTEAALGRFRAERRILAGLQHPNIARLLDAGATEDGLPYFVMEYVDGSPLLDYATPLSTRQCLELFRSVCAAVQYAHQNLVVHRDLKPGNILVTADGTAKLLDFGIAKLLDPESAGSTLTLTGTGVRLMTPDYASPEQVRGEPVTTATDIYSLGVILYELLTGRRPHHIETSSPAAIERAICLEEPTKPSAVNPRLDHDLDNIVLLALRKEPQRRYASVEQFSEDIRRYLEGRPIRARKDTLGYRANRFVRRNKLAVAAAALVVLGTLTGLAAVNRQARRAEYRFQQVRKLADTVLFDLNSEIESLAGSTKARELLVKTSLAYLDSLAAEGSNDPAFS
jgi:serine/threonine protein kinase